MGTTTFNPPAARRKRIAPTEDDPRRGGVVCGVPHDESTFALGGVAGHAGLFSTAADLLRLGRLWLHEGTVGGKTLIRRDLIRASIENNFPAAIGTTGFRLQRFALGWGLDDRSYIGSFASPRAYSLLGFTGTGPHGRPGGGSRDRHSEQPRPPHARWAEPCPLSRRSSPRQHYNGSVEQATTPSGLSTWRDERRHRRL